MFQIKSIKEQYELKDKILKERLEQLLPKIMRNSKADAWVIACKEYHEDLLFPHPISQHAELPCLSLLSSRNKSEDFH